MNSANTPSKLTPPVYVVKSPGLSANPKPKTPTSEYLQKPNRSVSKSSVDKENTRVTPAGKAPRTAQKSSKNTPSEEFVNSASRNRLPSTNKDKVSTSKKSPFGRAEIESARDVTPRKFQTPGQEANKSSARSKQGTDSRPQSAIRLPDSIKKFAQKNLLEAQSASKLGTKSVDKELVLRHFRTEEKNTAKNEGKMSSRSENLYSRAARDGSGSRKMSGTRPIPEEENEMDLSREEKKIVMHLRQNLEDILDDVNTSIQMTAQQMRGSSKKNTPKHIGSARKMQVEEEEEKDEQEVKLEDEMELNGADDMKDKTERKEYSVYEDWRILDTIENLMEKGEAKSLSSRVLWANIIDPLTGLKLLDGRRSCESLRDRYKRYISCLDEAGKNLIKDFCDKNMLPELKRNHCIFKKVDGVRQLTGISSQLSYNPERISRKTPYGTKAPKRSPAAKDSKKGRKKSEGERKMQEEFEEEHQAMTLRNRVDGVLLGGNEEGDIEEMTQTETKVVRMLGGQRDLSRQVVITKDFETVVRRKPEEKPKAVGFSMTSTNVPVREAREKAVHLSRSQQHERPGFIHSDSFQDSRLSQRMGDVVRMSEQMKASKKRKADDYTGFGEVGRKDLKQIKTNNAYEEQHIQLNEVFQSRKPVARLGNDLENFMIYVDLADGYRQFVKPDSDDEEEDEIEARLKELAKIYKIDFALVVSAFSKVSCDYRDLEEFLQTRDERLLWTEEEDADLLNDDKVAIKYLRMMKGEERVAKRKEYLLEIVE